MDVTRAGLPLELATIAVAGELELRVGSAYLNTLACIPGPGSVLRPTLMENESPRRVK